MANGRWLERGRQRYVEPPANRSHGAFLNFAVSWDRHFPHVFGIQPDVMITTVVVQQTAMIAKMALQLGSLHSSPLR
jgi:hypothetical protein